MLLLNENTGLSFPLILPHLKTIYVTIKLLSTLLLVNQWKYLKTSYVTIKHKEFDGERCELITFKNIIC